MPMDRSLYPHDWDVIAKEVKNRANWHCEECGLAHGAVIIRDSLRPSEYQHQDSSGVWIDMDGLPLLESEVWLAPAIKVVITVHHIGTDKPDGTPGDPYDKMDNRPENLKALCQRCHLLADLDNHIRASKATRQKKLQERRQAAGQKGLW